MQMGSRLLSLQAAQLLHPVARLARQQLLVGMLILQVDQLSLQTEHPVSHHLQVQMLNLQVALHLQEVELVPNVCFRLCTIFTMVLSNICCPIFLQIMKLCNSVMLDLTF